MEAIHGQARIRLPMPIRYFHADNAPATFRCLLEQLDTDSRHCTLSRPVRTTRTAMPTWKRRRATKSELVGRFRLDPAETVHLLNRLHETEDVISNFFIPSAKLAGEEYDRNGRVVRQQYDRPRTPYRRSLGSPKINNRAKRRVVAVYRELDIVALRSESDHLQRELPQHFTR